MDTKVFLATSQDINAQGAQEKYHIYGGHRSILSTQVNAEENGATRLISINQSDFNDAYIALNSGMSEETMIEVIAHELGHLIEKTLLKNASKETLDAIKADFQQWLASVKGVSKREHLALMRNRHIAQMNMQRKQITAVKSETNPLIRLQEESTGYQKEMLGVLKQINGRPTPAPVTPVANNFNIKAEAGISEAQVLGVFGQVSQQVTQMLKR